MNRVLKFVGTISDVNIAETLPLNTYTKYAPTKLRTVKKGANFTADDATFAKLTKAITNGVVTLQGITSGVSYVEAGTITVATSLVVTLGTPAANLAYEVLMDNSHYQVTVKSLTSFTIALIPTHTSGATTVKYAVIK